MPIEKTELWTELLHSALLHKNSSKVIPSNVFQAEVIWAAFQFSVSFQPFYEEDLGYDLDLEIMEKPQSLKRFTTVEKM